MHHVIESCRIVMFADDTTIKNAGIETRLLITEDLNNMTNWFISNNLAVSVGECEAISLGCGKPDKIIKLSK